MTGELEAVVDGDQLCTRVPFDPANILGDSEIKLKAVGAERLLKRHTVRFIRLLLRVGHEDPPVIIAITDGELVNERDSVTRTYTAGEAFIDPGQGNIHTATNPSETDLRWST